MTWHDMKHHANDRYLKYLNKGWDHDKLRSSDNN